MARKNGIPRKRVGVWLRLRDDYGDDRLIDAAALYRIREKKVHMLTVIPGVEGGHREPLIVAQLDQIVVTPALRLCEFRICWDAMPSAATIEEVSGYIDNLPAEPLSASERRFSGAG